MLCGSMRWRNEGKLEAQRATMQDCTKEDCKRVCTANEGAESKVERVAMAN